jgi:AraC family transcriptional regulator
MKVRYNGVVKGKRLIAKIFMWPGQALYVGEGFLTELHAHHALQFCVALDHHIALRVDGSGSWRRLGAFLIPSDHLHQIDGTGRKVAIMYVVPESDTGLHMRRALTTANGIKEVPGQEVLPAVPDLLRCFQEDTSCREAREALARMLEVLVDTHRPGKAMDLRVVAVIETMNGSISEGVSVQVLAEEVGLSPGRLSHLFKQQTGLPVRQYFLALKMLHAVRALADSRSLTEAAHAAGFADSAHMTRTFKRMLGLNPSFFLSYREFVQVIVCPSA